MGRPPWPNPNIRGSETHLLFVKILEDSLVIGLLLAASDRAPYLVTEHDGKDEEEDAHREDNPAHLILVRSHAREHDMSRRLELWIVHHAAVVHRVDRPEAWQMVVVVHGE